MLVTLITLEAAVQLMLLLTAPPMLDDTATVQLPSAMVSSEGIVISTYAPTPSWFAVTKVKVYCVLAETMLLTAE